MSVTTPPAPPQCRAYLEHFPEPGGSPNRIPVEPLPFTIGRSRAANLIVYTRQVSKEHSQVFCRGSDFFIRDLGSTNGTFVNGRRVDESSLANGDIIHVANHELKFAFEPTDEVEEMGRCVTELGLDEPPTSHMRRSAQLRELIGRPMVKTVFQPIVELATKKLFGYEALGRGAHPGLTALPGELFLLADQCSLARDLSRSFRVAAAQEAAKLPPDIRIFFNLHPAEMEPDYLLETLKEFRSVFRGPHYVVWEVHEAAVADTDTIKWLRQQLNEFGIGLAYDDFGAGQARLMELAEVPPDFIKFDMKLVRGIDRATPRQELLQALARVMADLKVQRIAEGIETPAEAAVCAQLGCPLGQGHWLGRPQPLPQSGRPEDTPAELVTPPSPLKIEKGR